MAGQWKMPFAATQQQSRNFYFGSSSASPWCNDLSHRHACKHEERIAMDLRSTPVQQRERVRSPDPRLAPQNAKRARAPCAPQFHLYLRARSCRVPRDAQAVAPVPWACQYDANIETWSPFRDTPEIPIVRPRTALMMMRKMLTSNPAAGLSKAASPHTRLLFPETVSRFSQTRCVRPPAASHIVHVSFFGLRRC
jgi:hypothetical protein